MSDPEVVRCDRPRKANTNEQRHLRRIIRLREVEALTGKKRSAIYEAVAKGTFPAPIPLGPRAVGWLEDEIANWQEECIASRAERRPKEQSAKAQRHGQSRVPPQLLRASQPK
jgi:prophage regulatory protein